MTLKKIQNACQIAILEGSMTTRRIGRTLGKALHGLRLLVLVFQHRLRQLFPHSLHLPARKYVIDNHETRLGLKRVPAHVVGGLGLLGLKQHATFDDAEKIQQKKIKKE